MKPFLFLMALEALLFFSCSKSDENAAPLVNFTFSGSEQFAPDSVAFRNLSLNATSYLWDFGDGNTSTLENPMHTYITGGNFTVTLTATGAGMADSYQQPITIKRTPVGFTVNSVLIKQFPNKKPDGSSWDSDGPPDIYIAIGKNTDSSNYIYTSPTVYENATSPGNYYFPLNIPLAFQSWRVAIYDRDGSGIPLDDLVGEVNLSSSLAYPAGYEVTNGSIDLVVNLTWQY